MITRLLIVCIFLIASTASTQSTLQSIAKETGIIAISTASGAVTLQLLNQDSYADISSIEDLAFYSITGLAGISMYTVLKKILDACCKKKQPDEQSQVSKSMIPAYITGPSVTACIVTVGGCLGLLGVKRGSFLITSLAPYIVLKTLLTQSPNKEEADTHVAA